MATTPSPSFSALESPRLATLMAFLVSAPISASFTETTARSMSGSVPFTWAEAVEPSTKVTCRSSESATTWLLVARSSSASFSPTMMPDPLPDASYFCGPKKKSFWVMTILLLMATTEGIASSTIPETSLPVDAPASATAAVGITASWLSSAVLSACAIPETVSSFTEAERFVRAFTPAMVPPAAQPNRTPARAMATAFLKILFLPDAFCGSAGICSWLERRSV